MCPPWRSECLAPSLSTLTRPDHDLQGAASTPLARIPLPPVALSGNPLRTHTCGSRSARVSTRGGAKPSSQTILFPFDFHPPHHFEMNSSPIYFFLDVMPQQARTSRLPTWVWGISERFSTGQRSPTRLLTVYAPKPQVSSLVHATGKGATGSARGWACAVENLCRRNPPDPCLGAPATTRIIKEQRTATSPLL